MRISLACAEKLFRAINTPRALTCALLLREREWDQLATLSVDPMHYLDARAYYLDALCTEFLRKHADLDTSFDRRNIAISKSLEAEGSCAQTNARFISLRENFFEAPSDVLLADFLREVKNEVRKVLGRVPDEVFPRFGPGATVDDRGRFTTVIDKMVSTPTISAGAVCFLKLWETTAWGREYLRRPEKAGLIRLESAGRFTTVPKDSKTDRPIDIQPSINIIYQLGVGGAIRTRLARWGIDLNTGQELHKRVACESSVSGEYATIDLSSASDTISYEVVKALLPTEWFSLLDSLRTPFSRLPDGRRLFLQKFSAMGNGFTFELETLIFSCLVSVTLRRLGLPSQAGSDFSVYGDDILVPVASNRAVLAVLQYFGFIPNIKKTFSTGHFRESCGGDFFDGQPVRAVYLKEEPDEPHKVIALANRLFDAIRRFNPFDVVVKRLRQVWFSILDLLPVSIRSLRGPGSLGDLVVHDYRGWDTRSVSADRMLIRVWQPLPQRLSLTYWAPWAQYAGALYGVDSRGITPRGAVSGYRRAWVALIERPR